MDTQEQQLVRQVAAAVERDRAVGADTNTTFRSMAGELSVSGIRLQSRWRLWATGIVALALLGSAAAIGIVMSKRGNETIVAMPPAPTIKPAIVPAEDLTGATQSAAGETSGATGTPAPASEQTAAIEVKGHGAVLTCTLAHGEDAALTQQTPCHFDLPIGEEIRLTVSREGYESFGLQFVLEEDKLLELTALESLRRVLTTAEALTYLETTKETRPNTVPGRRSAGGPRSKSAATADGTDRGAAGAGDNAGDGPASKLGESTVEF